MTNLKDEELEKVNGGLSQKETIDCINKNWQIIPEEIRNKIIDTYITLGPPATIKLIQHYIDKSHMDYLAPLLDLFR